MDALKNATNVGTSTTSQQSGQEPVSGEEGAGTATQPFDQGNALGGSSLGKRRKKDWDADCWYDIGKEGAGPKEGMSEALGDTKKAASDAAAG